MREIRLSLRIHDLIGKQFGRLRVIEFAGLNNQRHARWKCLCDCGKQTIIDGGSLTRIKGNTKSCGCLRSETTIKTHQLPKGKAAFNLLYAQYKSKQNQGKKHKFFLSKKEFEHLTSANCHYCGTPPTRKFLPPHLYNGAYICNGVDRIDNTKDYTLDNCVPCCWPCNKLKLNHRYNEFISRIIKIANHLGKNNEFSGN